MTACPCLGMQSNRLSEHEYCLVLTEKVPTIEMLKLIVVLNSNINDIQTFSRASLNTT